MADDSDSGRPAASIIETTKRRPLWPWLAGLTVLSVLAVGVLIGWSVSLASLKPAKPPAASAVPPGAIVIKEGAPVEWSEDGGPAQAVYAVDGLVITLKGKDTKDGRVAALHLVGSDGRGIDMDGEVGFDKASMTFMVGRLDTANPTPQVVAMSFTGGAHCCTSIQVLTFVGGVWRRVDFGFWDGEVLADFPTDEDGDGRPDLASYDNRFLYVFAPYADSYAPSVFFDLIGDKRVEVSAEPRFRDAYQDGFDRDRKACREHSNGACAAFVADAARLGRVEEAWPEMLANYDRESEWSLPTACRNKQPGKTCDKADEVTFATFPEALRWFLGDTGYMSPMTLPPSPHASGPSFDCGKASNDLLRLICADAGLASQDRDLGILYSRVLLLVPDAAGVKRDEQAFLQARDAAGPDREALAALYGQRLEALRHQVGE